MLYEVITLATKSAPLAPEWRQGTKEKYPKSETGRGIMQYGPADGNRRNDAPRRGRLLEK